MRTKNMMRHLAWGLLGLVTQQVFSQVTIESNNGLGGAFVGWNSVANQNLEVRNNANQPIQWFTDSIQRMQLFRTQNSTVNGLTGVNQNGFLGISNQPLFFSSAAGPFSRLHLADSSSSNSHLDFAQQYGYRRWMRNGITMTGNRDQCYIGQKYGGSTSPNDSSDLVLQWSDNPHDQQWATDRLRFLFTTGLNTGVPYGARSNEGLESFRVYIPNDTSAFVGIGDWWRATVLNAGVTVDPSERLDVLDRTIRIRRLIPDYNNDTLSRAVVVDGNGRLHWRRIDTWPTVPAASDCDWTIQNPVTSGPGVAHSLFTAFGSNDLCPDATDNVGIGTNSVEAGNKVTILENTPTEGRDRGLFVKVEGDDTFENVGVLAEVGPLAGENSATLESVGVRGIAVGSGGNNVGVSGRAQVTSGTTPTVNNGVDALATAPANSTLNWNVGVNSNAATTSSGSTTSTAAFRGLSTHYGSNAKNHGIDAMGWGDAGNDQLNYGGKFEGWSYGSNSENYGVYAVANGAGASSSNFGLYARATGNSTSSHWNYGVYGDVGGIDTLRTWAGYFTNRVQIMGNLWNNATFIFSDAELKTNVETLTPTAASELLVQLEPKTYHYAADNFPEMNLPRNTQFGFLAQEVEAILPQLVGTTEVAPVYDTTGVVLTEAHSVKGVNYVGLIPVLVAGYKAQEQRLAEMEMLLADMQQALAACCVNPGAGDARMHTGEEEGTTEGDARKLSIAPNPFHEQTTLYYTLEKAGRAQLLVNSSDGKQLRVLHEATQQAGDFQHVWNTTELAPGLYYVTLLLDGEPVVKKAVKVAR